jgi:hypothetical protein
LLSTFLINLHAYFDIGAAVIIVTAIKSGIVRPTKRNFLMTGINFNVQNSYAALYTTSQPKLAEATSSISAPKTSESFSGEKLTLSTQAIELFQQEQKNSDSQQVSPASNGFGVRPPPFTPPPTEVTPASNGFGVRPPSP